MRNRVLIIIFAAAAALCAAVIMLRGGGNEAKTAEIIVDGEIVRTIDLNAAAEPYDIRIEGGGGYNIAHVERGSISVTEADCPDKICVSRGVITDSAYPIVCLPHKMVIKIVSDEAGQVDGMTGR